MTKEKNTKTIENSKGHIWKYTGTFDEEGKACGVGTATGGRNGKDSYSGYWLNDKFHGLGTYIYPNGNKQIAEWKEGSLCGKLSMHDIDGEITNERWHNGHNYDEKEVKEDEAFYGKDSKPNTAAAYNWKDFIEKSNDESDESD